MVIPSSLISQATPIVVAALAACGTAAAGFFAGRKKRSDTETDALLTSVLKANRYLADRLQESQVEAEDWRHKFWALEAAKTGSAVLLTDTVQTVIGQSATK